MPFFAHYFISNLFELFFRPKNTVYLRLGYGIAPSRHRSVTASLRHGIDSASMPSSPRARLRHTTAPWRLRHTTAPWRLRHTTAPWRYGTRLRHGDQGTRLRHGGTVHDCAMETRAHDCATKTKAPHRCLFLSNIFISNLFELFFRPKNTVSLRHGIDSASMPRSL
jgi:hypothetical protein